MLFRSTSPHGTDEKKDRKRISLNEEQKKRWKQAKASPIRHVANVEGRSSPDGSEGEGSSFRRTPPTQKGNGIVSDDVVSTFPGSIKSSGTQPLSSSRVQGHAESPLHGRYLSWTEYPPLETLNEITETRSRIENNRGDGTASSEEEIGRAHV